MKKKPEDQNEVQNEVQDVADPARIERAKLQVGGGFGTPPDPFDGTDEEAEPE